MIHRLELPAGAVVAGDFRIVAPLAQGGMGSVYRVEQLSTGRPRALKVMHPGLLQDAAQRQRFAHEARASGLADSPHIVDVVAAGVDEGSGIPWLAMELLSGDTLAAVLQQRDTLPRAEVRALFAQLGHALGRAHRVGVVHRDLKPDNLFLAPGRTPSEPFFLKVLDFGIAKVVQDSAAGNTRALGTPLWMAPEQATTGGRITPATDVWPLGLIAYQCLTGRHFWRAADDPKLAGVGVLKEIAVDPLPKASARAAEQGRAGLLPLGFDGWFARCVHRESAARFSQGAAAAEALEALLADAPSSMKTSGASKPQPALGWADTVAATPSPSAPIAPAPSAPRLAPGIVLSAPQGVPVGGPARVYSLPRPVAPRAPGRRLWPWVALGVAVGTLVALGTLGWWLSTDDPDDPANTERRPTEPASTPAVLPLEEGRVYAGTYVCDFVPQRVSLRFDGPVGYQVRAQVSFVTQDGAAGRYLVAGVYEPAGQHLRLRFERWVQQPEGYAPLDFDGNFAPDWNRYTGHVLHPRCAGFDLARGDRDGP